MNHPTRDLAGFASELKFADIPAPAVAHAKLCLLDTLGCGLFGSTLPWSRILREVASETDGDGPARAIGGGVPLPAPTAALVTGTAIHGFELDDLHQRSILHPGSVVVSSLLAVAQAGAPLDGERFIAAMIAGYEVGARAGMSMGAAHLLRGYHPTGTHGTVAAAAAAAAALGLPVDEALHAIGIAGSQAAGLMAAQYSSMVKRFHAGRAAQSGVYAALLARSGFTGITDLFEVEYGGYCSTLSPMADLGQITAGLGETWEVEQIGFKPYSTNGSCHTTIDLLRELRQAHDIEPQHVTAVVVEASSATKQHVGWPYVPDSITTAQMNLPYIAAVTLTDGDAFVEQFTEERIRDPALVELASRVNVVVAEDIDAGGPSHRHAVRLRLELDDGRVLREERQYAWGSGYLPLTRDEIVKKYQRLTLNVLSAEREARLLELVGRVDKLSDLSEILDLVS